MNHETHRMVAVGVRLTILGNRHVIVPKAWNAQQVEAYVSTLSEPNFDINPRVEGNEDDGQISLLTNDESAVCAFDRVDSVEYIHPIFEVLDEHEILAMENHPDFVDDEETAPDEDVVGEDAGETKLEPQPAEEALATDSEPQEPLRS